MSASASCRALEVRSEAHMHTATYSNSSLRNLIDPVVKYDEALLAQFGGFRGFGGGQIYVDNETKTAREIGTRSVGTPEWTNPVGFEKDVFTFARLRYDSPGRSIPVGRNRGGWTTDLPDADLNLSYRLQQMTAIKVDPNAVKRKAQREFARLQELEFERYDSLISNALDTSDLPKSPYVVKKIADYMLLGLNEGIDVSPQDVLPLVRDEIQSDLREMFTVMPDEVIEKIVGKDVFNRVRKKNLAKAKATPSPVRSSVKDTGAAAKPADASKGGAQKKSFRDFFGV